MLISLRKRIQNQKGFTLVELMVVIAILGILAAIAIPKFSSSTNAAQDARMKADLRTVENAIAIHYATNNNTYPADQAALVGAGKTLSEWPVGITYAKTDTGYKLYATLSSGNKEKSPGSEAP